MLGTNFPYDGFIPDGIEIVQVDRLDREPRPPGAGLRRASWATSRRR